MSMAYVAIGTAVLGTATSIYTSNQASGAVSGASDKSNKLLQQQYNQTRADLAPYRYVGGQALNSLGNAMGLDPYGLGAGTASGYAPITVKGRGGGGGSSAGGLYDSLNEYNPMMPGKGLDPVSRLLGGGDGPSPKYGATIDPITGTVTIPGDPERSAMMTEYLRTGQGGGGKKLSWVTAAIDQLRASGWTYDPNRTAANAASATGKGPQIGQFQTSPGYQFVRDEGTRGIERTAAARGGMSSGNTLRALDAFNSGLASQEYGNWWNRMAGLAGVGQTATTSTAGFGANAANQQAQNNMTAGDARASGYLTAGAGAINAGNTALNNWLLYRGGYFTNPQTTTPTSGGGYSPFGPYATGYQFPG